MGGVMQELRRLGVAATRTSPPWLTERGHLEPIVRQEAPAEVLDALDDIHAALGGDRKALARRQPAPLHGVLRLGDGRLVAIDGLAHFTTERFASFEHYPASFTPGFSIDQYLRTIETWRRRAAAVFTRRWSPDFDFAGGRRAQRAYEDALHDLLIPVFTGRPLTRIASPDDDAQLAAAWLAGSVAAAA